MDNNLNLRHLEDLRNSAISAETASRYGIVSLSEEEVRIKLGRDDINGEGLFIPYPQSSCYRVKPDSPRVIKRTGKKDQVIKYENPYGMILDLFISDTARKAFSDVNVPFVFTEGEKKAISGEENLELAMIGLPGVNGAWSKNKQVAQPLLTLPIKGRECFIVFDADKNNNEQLLKTEKDFAEVLHSLGACVRIINLDAALGKGLDDQIKEFLIKQNISEFKTHYFDAAETYDEYVKRCKEEKKCASKYSAYWDAEQLVAMFGEEFRWCEELKSWYVWNGRYWKKDSGALRVEKYAKKMTKEMMKSESKDLQKHAKHCQEKHALDAMVDLSKSEDGVLIETEEFNKDGYLLNCSNGILDLKAGKLMPHDPGKYISRIVDIDYSEEAVCPKWLEFLNDIFDGNQNIINFLQKAVGYSLTDSTAEHCFFICYGTGRNGKNTFFDTIRALLGEYACKTRVSTLMVKPKGGGDANEDIAQLWGKRMVTASESDTSHRLSESTVKEITGDMFIRARFLYGHTFEFTPTFKIFLITNKKPKITGTDEGIWSRVRFIPFTKLIPIEKRIPDLAYWFIKNEAQGILRWLVEGCQKWQVEGLGEVKEIIEAKEEYRQEEDLIGQFIEERCIVGETCQNSSPELYQNFKVWQVAMGYYPKSIQEFTRNLEARGYKNMMRTYGPQKGHKFWHGIGLLQKNQEEPLISTGGSFPLMEDEQ